MKLQKRVFIPKQMKHWVWVYSRQRSNVDYIKIHNTWAKITNHRTRVHIEFSKPRNINRKVIRFRHPEKDFVRAVEIGCKGSNNKQTLTICFTNAVTCSYNIEVSGPIHTYEGFKTFLDRIVDDIALRTL